MSISFAAAAERLGFVAVGITDAHPPRHYARFISRVEGGLPEGLDYLRRSAALRKDFDALLPDTRSILCAAYPIREGLEQRPFTWATFCALPDYHDVLREKLEALIAWLRDAGYPIARTRLCVDSAPILERELAARSGLGFIGYHQNLIVPSRGSFVLLCEALFDTDLTPYREELSLGLMTQPTGCVCKPERRLCEKACPTGALSQGRYRTERCLAYWTTQHRGAIPEPIMRAMGDRIWGCDTCQDACPFNREKPMRAATHTLYDLDPTTLLTASAAQLRKKLQGTPLSFAPPYMLQRNACIALGNLRLAEYLALIIDTEAAHPKDWVRSAAAYAIERIRANP